MGNNNKKKKEPWRIIVFVIAVAFIIFIWVKKVIAYILTTMPASQIAPIFVPLIVTTVVVSLLKVAAIVGAILLIKWIVGKIRNK